MALRAGFRADIGAFFGPENPIELPPHKASTDTNTVTIINTFINKSMTTSEGELIRQQVICSQFLIY